MAQGPVAAVNSTITSGLASVCRGAVSRARAVRPESSPQRTSRTDTKLARKKRATKSTDAFVKLDLMGRDDGRGKRKARQIVESDEDEDEAPKVVELEDDEDEERPAKGKAAKKSKEDGGRKSSGGAAGSSRRSAGGAGPSGSGGAGRGGDEGGVADCADVKLSDLIKEAKDRLEEAEGALKNDVGDTVRNNLVRDVIRYMLFTNPRTKDAPVPKSELTSIVSKISKERGLGDVVIRSVQLQLLEKFGIEMVELTKRKKAQKVGKAETADKLEFVLRSTVPAKVRSKVVDQPASLALRGLAMVVVSLLSISGGQIPEEDLLHHLASLGVPKGAKTHPALGDVAGALDTLCKQRFVVLEADPSDSTKKVYALAEAAQAQLGPDLVNKFIGFYAQPGTGGGEDDE